MNRGAIRCILSQKAREEKLVVVNELQLERAKTSEMAKVLSNLGITTPTLIVTHNPQADVILSARNIGRVKTLPAPQINPLDLLNHDRLIMTAQAVRRAEELWASLDAKVDDEAPGQGEE
jgi:large subunit ribosomal protein L4